MTQLYSERITKIVCSMVLQDIPSIEPVFHLCSEILKKPDSSFVFCIPHPCFNAKGVTFSNKSELGSSEPHIKIAKYLSPQRYYNKGKPNQPIDYFAYHRPLSTYINAIVDSMAAHMD